jgi:predicted nuclease of predicted toxin-antitoxin system
LRILFDKNVPVGLRNFLPGQEVWTFVRTGWPAQLENGELLRSAENNGFDVMVTADQNIRYQQNLAGRKLALVVLGSNVWPIVKAHATEVAAAVDLATTGSYSFIQMSVPRKPRFSK